MGKYLVAGGSSGIGRQLTEMLSKEGHEVIVLSRSDQEVSQVSGVTHHEVDFSQAEPSLPDVGDALDGLAYCPGSINLKPFRSLKTEVIQEDFQLNAVGAFLLAKHCFSALKNGQNPSMVFFSTVAVQTGMPFHVSVAMAKGALEGMVRTLAAEMAPTIRVNAIAPSLTDTPMASRLLRNDKQRDAATDRHPLKKLGTPTEVAHLAHFLLSDQSAWMTGQVLGLDGGMSSVRL